MTADAEEDVDSHDSEDGEGYDLEDEPNHHCVVSCADAGHGASGCHYCSCAAGGLAWCQ